MGSCDPKDELLVDDGNIQPIDLDAGMLISMLQHEHVGGDGLFFPLI